MVRVSSICARPTRHLLYLFDHVRQTCKCHLHKTSTPTRTCPCRATTLSPPSHNRLKYYLNLMSSFLWTLLLPFALGKTVRIDITKDTPGTRWSPGWSTIAGSQYFGGTLASARDADATLIFEFAGRLSRISSMVGIGLISLTWL